MNPAELRLNKAYVSDTESGFLDFPFLDGDVPRRSSYGVYIFQLIPFARAPSHVNETNS